MRTLRSDDGRAGVQAQGPGIAMRGEDHRHEQDLFEATVLGEVGIEFAKQPEHQRAGMRLVADRQACGQGPEMGDLLPGQGVPDGQGVEGQLPGLQRSGLGEAIRIGPGGAGRKERPFLLLEVLDDVVRQPAEAAEEPLVVLAKRKDVQLTDDACHMLKQQAGAGMMRADDVMDELGLRRCFPVPAGGWGRERRGSAVGSCPPPY